MAKLTERPTADLLVLLIAGTICFSVVATGATIAFIEIRDPDVDTSTAASILGDYLNTLIGLLAGFIAGRTEGHLRATKRGDSADESDG